MCEDLRFLDTTALPAMANILYSGSVRHYWYGTALVLLKCIGPYHCVIALEYQNIKIFLLRYRSIKDTLIPSQISLKYTTLTKYPSESYHPICITITLKRSHFLTKEAYTMLSGYWIFNGVYFIAFVNNKSGKLLPCCTSCWRNASDTWELCLGVCIKNYSECFGFF